MVMRHFSGDLHAMNRPLLNLVLLAVTTGLMSACVLPSIPKPHYGIITDRIWSNGTETYLAYSRQTTIGLAGPGMHAYPAERSKLRFYYLRLDLSALRDGDTITLGDDTPAADLVYMDRDFTVTGAPPGLMQQYSSVTFNTRGIASTVACTPRTEAAALRVENDLIYCGYRVRAGGKAEPAPPALLKHRGETAAYQDGAIYFYTHLASLAQPTDGGPITLARVDARNGQGMGTVTLSLRLENYVLRPEHFAQGFLFVRTDKKIMEFQVCTASTCRSFMLGRDYDWDKLTRDYDWHTMDGPIVIGQTGDELVVLKDLDRFDDDRRYRVLRIKAGAPAREW